MRDEDCDRCAELSAELDAEKAARQADAREARDELERVKADAGKLLRTVSHDVRTPLNNVFGALELAGMMAHKPADLSRWLSVAHASSVRLRLMLDDLIAHARNDTESGPMTTVPVDVAQAVGAAVDEARMLSIAQHRSIEVQLDAFTPGATVQAQPDELRHVVVDLLVNALLHRSDGDIVVRVTGHDHVGDPAGGSAAGGGGGSVGGGVAGGAGGSARFEVADRGLLLDSTESSVLNQSLRAGDEQYFASDGFAITVATRLLERLGSTLELQRDADGFVARFELPVGGLPDRP